MRRRVRSAVVTVVVAALAGCGGGGSSEPPPVGSQGWTVLVYMTADNNLEADGLRDLMEMATVGSGSDLRYVVQVDRAVGEYTGGVLNLGDFTSTKRLLVQRGQLQVLSDLGEVDMGQAAALADFVNWGVQAYPGQRYMLVLWDHGGGWKGFGWDDSHPLGTGEPDHLSLDRIVAGVSQGLTGTGVAKLDVIGFDACLMATLEVATSLAPYASYLLASEELEPGHGWDWAAFGGGGALDPVALGRKVIDGYYAQAQSAQWNDAADVTLSLVDLSRIGAVQTALAGLAGTYGTPAAVAPILTQVAAGRRAAQEYASNPDPAQAYSLVDMVDLFAGMGGVTGGAAVQSAVGAAVVYQRAGVAKAGSHGLSIYFPPDGSLYQPGYDALPGMGAWRTFLAAVFGGGAAQAAPAFASGTYDATAGLSISGLLAADVAVDNAYLAYGLPDGLGGAYLLGDYPASQAGLTVTGGWDWSILQITQGATIEYGYLSLEVAGANLYAASIPLSYQVTPGAAEDLAVWRIVFDGGGTVAANAVYLYSGGGVAELSPATGSRLHALVQYMPSLDAWSSSWVRSDGGAGLGFDATQPLSLDLPVLPSGTVFAALLRAENSAAQGDWIYVTGVQIP